MPGLGAAQPAAGALLGLALTISLLRAFPVVARSGQPLGLAKIQNVSPNANLRNLAVLALAAVVGAIVFARFRRTEKAGWVRHELTWLGCGLALLVALDSGTVAVVLLSGVPWAALAALTGSGRVASPRPIDCALAAAAALVTWVLLARASIGGLGSPAGLAIVLFGSCSSSSLRLAAGARRPGRAGLSSRG
jgi:hypothetical protein